ncbi:MBL fold metallo-hydrolase [Treponema sp.]|uniref:MBL fold metallo-hydrolase n=1 Tax=Treponema sp. TaxID=166 RepID=UPI003F114C61
MPTPLKNDQVQAKIAAAISRLSPKDLESSESKMRFLSSLPDWIYGTIGGNTPCIELRSRSGKLFLLDCGTGLREFSVSGRQPEDKHYTIFLSHFHWDHIQGFPFFGQSFSPDSKIDIYTPFQNAEDYLERQSSLPFFPMNACFESVKNQLSFHLMEEDVPIEIAGVKIKCHRMFHPGDSYSYSFEEDGKRFIYSTDVELQASDFDKSRERNAFFKDADVLVFDSQYTAPEAAKKINWGHNSFRSAIDFASNWNIRNLYFFHHEPNYDDKKLEAILDAGNNYKKYKSCGSLNLYISREGQEIQL